MRKRKRVRKPANLGAPFAERLRVSRRLAGYARRQDLAEAVGLSVCTVRDLETGRATPSAVTLITLREVLGVSCDYLLGLDEPETAADQVTQSALSEPAVLGALSEPDTRALFMSRFLALYHAQRHCMASLSVASGLSEHALGNYRRGSRLPRGYQLRQLCRALGTTADYLLGLDK